MKKKWDELVVNVILLALGAVALFLLIQIIDIRLIVIKLKKKLQKKQKR